MHFFLNREKEIYQNISTNISYRVIASVDQNILLILFFPIRLRRGITYLSLEILDSESYSILNKFLLKFIRMIPNSIFNVADIYGIKLLRIDFILENINSDIIFRTLLIYPPLAV